MTLESAQTLVNTTLTSAGVFRFCPVSRNSRLSRTLGRARLERRNGQAANVNIELSAAILDHATPEQARQTILHECAHVIVFVRDPRVNHGHDYAFRAVCAEIGCNNDTAKVNAEFESPAYKYEIICPNCGILGGTNRKTKIISNPAIYHCTACRERIKVKVNW